MGCCILSLFKVLYEMKQTLKPDKFNQVLENMEVLVRACHNLMGTPLGPNDLNEDKQVQFCTNFTVKISECPVHTGGIPK